MLRLLLKTPEDPALLLPRLTLGVVSPHGAQKVLGWLALILRGSRASLSPVLATKVQG